jgi:hypothetical protein
MGIGPKKDCSLPKDGLDAIRDSKDPAYRRLTG